ncbi:MAG: excinuclease ABC subunit B [Planctomycetota bacterium]|jgi:excinuclease ABC subunit B
MGNLHGFFIWIGYDMTGMSKFVLKSRFQPAGDQPQAIAALVAGIKDGQEHQTLLGVTGSGKTFTVANVIEQIQKPTLVIAHNKTLAAQLAQEYREFFPDAAVHYFVSYYDYYQPEAYMPVTDTFIEKDASINEEIDRLRHAATQALLSRRDVIIVASVSCIYGLGSPEEYAAQHLLIKKGQKLNRRELLEYLIAVHYDRTTADLTPGTFRSIGNKIEIMPVSERTLYSFVFSAGIISEILHIDPISSVLLGEPDELFLYPAKHFLTDGTKKENALKNITLELKKQLKKFEKEGKLLEAERIKRRTTYDLAMMREVGYCSGIENYSRQLSGKKPGEAPDTLISYFPHTDDGSPDFLTVIDESHVTLPQVRGMFAGDQARKKTLVEFGFRLPSALDNRPLQFPEFNTRVKNVLYVSATPAPYELEKSTIIAQQLIRPTGLLDPELTVKPVTPSDEYVGQVQDFINDTESVITKGGRVLATTLTKKMAEDLSVYLKERGIKSEYLHSDIKTIERIEILTSFRKGEFDCLVGVNLLREGLDLPEVSFIGILDADKEGFLRSETALMQTIGRAARNVDGRVTLYADRITNSMQRAMDETIRRRKIQFDHNTKHGITPTSIIKAINDITEHLRSDHDKAVEQELRTDLAAFGGDFKKVIKYKKEAMNDAVKDLDFETAALLRDELFVLEKRLAASKEKEVEKKPGKK